MHPGIPADTFAFLAGLLGGNCPQAGYLTLTAIHPDGKHHTPSRHIPLFNWAQLTRALDDLQAANTAGWGAFFAVAFRARDLGRWRRGGVRDLLTIPALYADIDHPPRQVISQLRRFKPRPSCLVASGNGVHAYWWLARPASDFEQVEHLLRGLAGALDGDSVSSAQSLRLPGTQNNKRTAYPVPCRLIEHNPDRRYSLADFAAYHTAAKPTHLKPKHKPQVRRSNHPNRQRNLNPRLVAAVSAKLFANYEAYWRSNGQWIAALCPLEHERDAPGRHFSFNPTRGLGVCLGKHGRQLLRELCPLLGLNPNDYGGIYQ